MAAVTRIAKPAAATTAAAVGDPVEGPTAASNSAWPWGCYTPRAVDLLFGHRFLSLGHR